MALSIEGATYGVDEMGMKAALRHVENNCINATKSALRSGVSALRDEVNNCWVGKSADTFKENIQHDVDDICAGLDEAYRGLDGAFKSIQTALVETDENLVTPR